MSKYIWLVDNLSFWLMWTPGLWIFCLLRKSENTNIQILSQELFSYVNVSDQSSIFTHETKMLISICWKSFLAFNVLHMTRTDGWIQNLKKRRDIIALKRQYVYSALLWHTVYCCVIQRLVTSDGSDGTQNDPGHPDIEWGWHSRRLGGPQGLK